MPPSGKLTSSERTPLEAWARAVKPEKPHWAWQPLTSPGITSPLAPGYPLGAGSRSRVPSGWGKGNPSQNPLSQRRMSARERGQGERLKGLGERLG